MVPSSLLSLNRTGFFIRIAILYKYVASKRFKTINLFASKSSYIMGTIPYRGELLNQFVYSFALWSDTIDIVGQYFLHTYVDHQFRHENIWSTFSLILVEYLGSS